jgi:hypothetical protein
MIALHTQQENARVERQKWLVFGAAVILLVVLIWAGLSWEWTDRDPRSIGHWYPAFLCALFGFFIMIKTNGRWHLGGAIAGAALGAAYILMH